MTDFPTPPIRNKDPQKIYEILPTDLRRTKVDELVQLVGDFKEWTGLAKDSHFNYSIETLYDIIDRVDKRDAYYFYFHRKKLSGVDISERKIGGLLAYWILKLRPLFVDFRDDTGINREFDQDEVSRRRASNVNENFAAFALYSMINKWYMTMYDAPLKFDSVIDSEFHTAMLYAFRYRNISIDAMMLLVEAIVPDTFSRKGIPEV